MLERRAHAGIVHAFDIGAGERGDDLRIGGKRAVADRLVSAAQVHHRREAEIHPGRADLTGHQPGVFVRQVKRGVAIAPIERVEALQRRQVAVALAEALHAPAFLVDADQLRETRRFTDRLRQFRDLCAAGEVAGEQDHAGAGIVLQPVALGRAEFGATDADDQHGTLRPGRPVPTMRPLSPMPQPAANHATRLFIAGVDAWRFDAARVRAAAGVNRSCARRRVLPRTRRETDGWRG